MPDLIEMIVFNVFTNRRGPNTEADRKTAYNNVQVGERGPNTEADKSQHTIMCKLGNNEIKFYENIISIPLLRITT
ncbi:nitrogen fixation protein NifR [Staphylococcus aureus]|nr:nitrogen fixation protein NifR [Staphylococcus aureus]PSH99258.1 nitrogen fixation protein NifR [Staphylococcus aureus]PZG49683.1 nitrogen fixation protein NifR [Staphylococcus aureus]PZG76468.1 nitrogen fixation protein NifR [Staphylococcus aureus]PZG79120.1 nitrogen fixation protein NifR [Staphylococcus aureus]